MTERDELVDSLRATLKEWQKEAGAIGTAEAAGDLFRRLHQIDPDAWQSEEVRTAVDWTVAFTAGQAAMARTVAGLISDVMDPRQHMSQRNQLESLASLANAMQRISDQHWTAQQKFTGAIGMDGVDEVDEAMRRNPNLLDNLMPPDPDDEP
jgi:pullulanase/glycogen debranching enzyme